MLMRLVWRSVGRPDAFFSAYAQIKNRAFSPIELFQYPDEMESSLWRN
jgi:hypothetical protein